MSKLILPGDPEFTKTTKVVSLAARRGAASSGAPESLAGRTLMLNLAKVRGFACGGFQVSMHAPVAVVSEAAQQTPLRQALADERLIDITGQDPKTGFKGTGGAVAPVKVQDTGHQVFIVKRPDGTTVVAAPKDEAQAKDFARQLKKTGTIALPEDSIEAAPTMTGLSGISVEDLPQPSPKETARGRTSRRQRQSRRG